MKTFMHYGKEVIWQQAYGGEFRKHLKNEGTSFVDLPILGSDVLMYSKDGRTRYACIKSVNAPDECLEDIYITFDIPLDMSWENLINDCDSQRHGEPPMVLPTKARLICDAAVKMIKDNSEFSFFKDPEISPADFKLALINLGYRLDDILSMDHHDVSNDFLEAMGK